MNHNYIKKLLRGEENFISNQQNFGHNSNDQRQVFVTKTIIEKVDLPSATKSKPSYDDELKLLDLRNKQAQSPCHPPPKIKDAELGLA